MRTQVPSSTAETLSVAGKDYLYVVHNDALQRILLDRTLVGLPFRRACLEASRLFVRHIADDLQDSDVSELMILSKGIVYQLAEAYGLEIGKNLPINLIATTRMSVDNDTAKIDVPYARLDAGGSTLLIGDTVASGATIIAALDEYIKSHYLSSVYLFSYAGTLSGATRIAEYCRAKDIRLTVLFGLAAFGLGENGFDLSFLNPNTISRQEYIDKALRAYNGRPVSAVGWDFGSQVLAPTKYRELSWVESRVLGITTGFGEIEKPTSFEKLWREKDAFSNALDELGLNQE